MAHKTHSSFEYLGRFKCRSRVPPVLYMEPEAWNVGHNIAILNDLPDRSSFFGVLGLKTSHSESAVWTAKWSSGYSGTSCIQEMHCFSRCNFECFPWMILILWVLGMKTCHLESAVWTAKWSSGYSCCSQEMHFLQKCRAVFPRSLHHVAILNVFPDWSSGWKPVTWSLLFELRNDVRATQEQVREEMHCLQECLPFVW